MKNRLIAITILFIADDSHPMAPLRQATRPVLRSATAAPVRYPASQARPVQDETVQKLRDRAQAASYWEDQFAIAAGRAFMLMPLCTAHLTLQQYLETYSSLPMLEMLGADIGVPTFLTATALAQSIGRRATARADAIERGLS